MRNRLLLVDVSSMLYAGQRGQSHNAYTASLNTTINGLPIGGIRYALRRLLTSVECEGTLILVFDSKTDKNKYCDGYKATRHRDPDIYIQQLMFKDMARMSGIPFMCKEGYEADDLVAYASQKYLNEFFYIDIYSGDSDLAANIIRDNMRVVGTAAIYPTIDAHNFEYTVKSNTRIPYNTILPYFMFFGKPSNNVKGFRGRTENFNLYNNFLAYCDEANITPGCRSHISTFCSWLLDGKNKGLLDDKTVAELWERTHYVFPKQLDDYGVEFDLDTFNSIDKQQLCFFLKAFNLDDVIADMKLQDKAAGVKPKDIYSYLDSYKQTYEEGTFAADNDLAVDESFAAVGNASDNNADKTDVFAISEDNF